jgi:hypothetical protein
LNYVALKLKTKLFHSFKISSFSVDNSNSNLKKSAKTEQSKIWNRFFFFEILIYFHMSNKKGQKCIAIHTLNICTHTHTHTHTQKNDKKQIYI